MKILTGLEYVLRKAQVRTPANDIRWHNYITSPFSGVSTHLTLIHILKCVNCEYKLTDSVMVHWCIQNEIEARHEDIIMKNELALAACPTRKCSCCPNDQREKVTTK